MVTLSTLSEIIVENFIIILILIAAVIIVYLLTHAAIKIKGLSLQTKSAQIGLENKKVDAIANKQRLENLREAAAMLTDSEREKIDGIKADKSILARRTIALMSEIEERVARLESGTENAQLGKTLGEIINHEKKLFRR